MVKQIASFIGNLGGCLMKNNININEKTDLFCVDCKSVTRQIYKGIYNDGTHQFICQECGCENYITDKEFNGE